MMKVKIVYGDDMRRWRFPESNKYASLSKFIRETFNFCDGSSFYIQFEDDENDKVTITNDSDLSDAFLCAEQENRKSLKIFVNEGPIEKTHSKLNLMGNDGRSAAVYDAPPLMTGNCGNNNGNNGFDIPNDAINDSSQEPNCAYWRECALDFLNNVKIQSLLPPLARRIIIGLKEEQKKSDSKCDKMQECTKSEKNNNSNSNENCNENSNDDNKEENESCNNDNKNDLMQESKDFCTIVSEILNEEKFECIANHEIYQGKIKYLLPHIGEKVEMYKNVLLQFNEDAIASWIPHLIQILIRALMSFENSHWEVDVDPMCHAFFPTWFAFMNQHGGCTGDNRENDSIHRSVTCDECGVSPIKGNRFKCTVCDNYDLCSNCESLSKHDRTHPLMKFSVRIRNCIGHQFFGLNQIIDWLGGPHSIFHSCPPPPPPVHAPYSPLSGPLGAPLASNSNTIATITTCQTANTGTIDTTTNTNTNTNLSATTNVCEKSNNKSNKIDSIASISSSIPNCANNSNCKNDANDSIAGSDNLHGSIAPHGLPPMAGVAGMGGSCGGRGGGAGRQFPSHSMSMPGMSPASAMHHHAHHHHMRGGHHGFGGGGGGGGSPHGPHGAFAPPPHGRHHGFGAVGPHGHHGHHHHAHGHSMHHGPHGGPPHGPPWAGPHGWRRRHHWMQMQQQLQQQQQQQCQNQNGSQQEQQQQQQMQSGMYQQQQQQPQWGKCGRGGGGGHGHGPWGRWNAQWNNNKNNNNNNEVENDNPCGNANNNNNTNNSNNNDDTRSQCSTNASYNDLRQNLNCLNQFSQQFGIWANRCNNNGNNNNNTNNNPINNNCIGNNIANTNNINNNNNNNKCGKSKKHNGCNNNGKPRKAMAEFVKDVTLPDRTYYPTDTILNKTWRMRNSGDTEWGNGVELVFFKGNESLSLQKRFEVINAQPNEEVEVSAAIQTPNKPGRYCSYFRLQRNGDFFGPRVWVDIFAVDEEGAINEKCAKMEAKKAANKDKGKLKKIKQEIKKEIKKEKQLDRQQQKISKKIARMEKKAAKIEQKQQKHSRKHSNNGDNNNNNDNNEENEMDDINSGNNEENDNIDVINGMAPAPAPAIGQANMGFFGHGMAVPMPMPVIVDNSSGHVQLPVLIDNTSHQSSSIHGHSPNHSQVHGLQAVAPQPSIIPSNNNNNNNNNSNNHNNRNQNRAYLDIMCVCGCPLIRTSPYGAYSANATATCDICNRSCNTHSSIYHCPQEGIPAHPHGYDLCSDCAEIQLRSFDEEEEEENDVDNVNAQRRQQQQQQHNDNDNNKMKWTSPIVAPPSAPVRRQNIPMAPNSANTSPSAQQQQQQGGNKNDLLNVNHKNNNDNNNNNSHDGDALRPFSASPINLPKSPIIPANVVEHLEKQEQALNSNHDNDSNNNNNNNNGDNGDNMELEDVNENVNDLYNVDDNMPEMGMHSGPIATPPPAMENDINEKENDNNKDDFIHADALIRISEMGFEANQRVRQLLVKHKGQVNRVVQDLLSLSY